MTADIFILPDAEAVAHRAASIFIDLSRIAGAARGRFSAAVSGGRTPLQFFRLLGTTYRKDIRWDLTDIFWVDERCVPPDHKDSNYKAAYDLLFSRVDIPETNLHRIRGEMSPGEGAREYEHTLRRCFGAQGLPSFDLVILGIGEDGHTASLFPDAPSLTEQKRLAVFVYAEKLKSWRITLTLPVLNNASQILFLVTGRTKSGIVKELFKDRGKCQKYPAGCIHPLHGTLTWLLDKEASILLQKT